MKTEDSNNKPTDKNDNTVQPDPDAKEQEEMYYSPAEKKNDENEIKTADDINEPDPEVSYTPTGASDIKIEEKQQPET